MLSLLYVIVNCPMTIITHVCRMRKMLHLPKNYFFSPERIKNKTATNPYRHWVYHP